MIFLKLKGEIVLRPRVSLSFSQSFIQYICLGVESLLGIITRILRGPVENFCLFSRGEFYLMSRWFSPLDSENWRSF